MSKLIILAKIIGVSLFVLLAGLSVIVFNYSVITTQLMQRATESNSSKIQRTESITQIFKNESVSGAALYSRGDRLISESYFGFSNPLSLEKVNTSTLFDIGSLTKQFTGFLALDALLKKKIKLTDSIVKYLPELHGTGIGKITIEHLIFMTSGLPVMLNTRHFITTQLSSKIYSPEDFLNIIRRYKLDFTPGTRFQYSNIGYKLLSIILGRLENSSWPDLVQGRIFTPLNMKNSMVEGIRPDRPQELALGMLPIRFFSMERLLILPHWNYSLIQGAGGILSTVNDLFKWNLSLSARAKVDPTWAKTYFESGKETKEGNEEFGYSFGWGRSKIKRRNGNEEAIYWHEGEDPGYCSLVIRFPTTDQLVLFLWNIDRCLQDGWDDKVRTKIISVVDDLM